MKIIPLEQICKKFAGSNLIIYLIWLFLLVILLVILKLQYFGILFPIVFANIGIGLFLIFKKWRVELPEKETGPVIQNDNNLIQTGGPIFNIGSILFFLIYSVSLLSLLQESYTKSILYYLCISCCTAILIFQIFSLKSKISHYIIIANHVVYPNGNLLPDGLMHFNIFVMSILTTGHVSNYPIGPYSVFSAHHIFAAESAILTGYNPLSMYLLLGSFIFAIGVLLVFIIGKRFVNFQFGLVSAVLFTCLDYYLMYGEHPEHSAYNYAFALICFTIILYTYRSHKPSFYILLIISTLGVVLNHHLTAIITFVPVCGLVIIDIYYFLQKRDRSIPSKYIAGIFAVILLSTLTIAAFVANSNPLSQISQYLSPYFTDLFTFFSHFTAAPPINPVVLSHTDTVVPTITQTVVPTITQTVVPTITQTVVPTITQTVVPTITQTVVPTVTQTVVPTVTQTVYVQPTVYDKLPLIQVFVNTLGSSLIILIATMGFCSLIKKRSWFWDLTIVNGIILSGLLGVGILSRYNTVFLPDRLYPFIQIFCLIFLGAYGILWMRNSIPLKNGSIIVTCICILVIMMSFFSLASIINGFETSPFVGENMAYPKLYTTSQDLSFKEWRNEFIPERDQTVSPVDLNKNGTLNINALQGNHYLSYDRTLEKTGRIDANAGLGKFGQQIFINMDNHQLGKLNSLSSYYDDGQIIMLAVPSS
jgi:hypothetical protein